MKALYTIFLLTMILVSCKNHGTARSESIIMPEKAKIIYAKTEEKVAALENLLNSANQSLTAQELRNLISISNDLSYDFDSTGMNRAAIDRCLSLQQRITALNVGVENLFKNKRDISVDIVKDEDCVIENMTEYPVYLQKGDILYYELGFECTTTVNLYNMSTRNILRSVSDNLIKDSLHVKNSGIYLIEIDSRSAQYASIQISYNTQDLHRIVNPVNVKKEVISCSKGDFRSFAVNGVMLKNMFDEPRKFTLRSQLKSSVSGSSIALVPIQVPVGTTDLLYSMRIATSEMDRSSDGKFHDNMTRSYKRVKFLGLPLYEKSRGNGLLNTLLDDNRPLREEDAYCNMFVFRNQSQAKEFQDNVSSSSSSDYDVDYSTVGTQSCNGRIPTNGQTKLYLGFENVRVRYTNYLWVEAVAVIPNIEYYTNVYTIE